MAGKQWIPQDGFEGVVFSCIYCLSRCASWHVYIYSISICYTSDTESLDEAVSYLNVCDQKKKIERACEFKSRDAMLSFVTGRLKRALLE